MSTVGTDLEADLRAHAHPTKAFFVQMLTRDISLQDCILDLVDNSVDAAWTTSGRRPTRLKEGKDLSNFEIEIDVSADEFVISDNCGGISLDDAINYAFTFGREVDEPRAEFTVGVYGIGMKRAVFKIGDDVSILSSPPEEQSFEVPITVSDWLKNRGAEWDFDIEPAAALPEPGLRIRVRSLTAETSTSFADPGFIRTLRSTIARDYMLPLMNGLTIIVNNKEVDAWNATFRESKEFSPLRQQFESNDVQVEIIAGMSHLPPSQTDAPEKRRDTISGWYVICNGRVVVAADRTSMTVWGGDSIPTWHQQYGGFVGFALFSARDPSLLPMTTTKRDVDTSSAVYKHALTKMRTPTRAWIDYTNARKHNREDARTKETATSSIPITKVGERDKVKLPSKIVSDSEKEANVLYKVPKARMRRLAQAFGRSTMAYSEVGRRSFDYSYDRLVDED